MFVTITKFELTEDQLFCKTHELKEKEPLTILVHSSGGCIDMALLYAMEVKRLVEKEHNVTVIGQYLGSSAFTFLRCLRNLPIMRICSWSTYGVVHQVASDISLMPNGKPRGNYDRFLKDSYMPVTNLQFPFLNEKQKELYDNGDDVYLNSKEVAAVCNATFLDHTHF